MTNPAHTHTITLYYKSTSQELELNAQDYSLDYQVFTHRTNPTPIVTFYGSLKNLRDYLRDTLDINNDLTAEQLREEHERVCKNLIQPIK